MRYVGLDVARVFQRYDRLLLLTALHQIPPLGAHANLRRSVFVKVDSPARWNRCQDYFEVPAGIVFLPISEKVDLNGLWEKLTHSSASLSVTRVPATWFAVRKETTITS
jgi:hypothetical protein